MSKISTYSLADEPLQLSDRLIGTEAPRPTPTATPLATKNFSLGELLQLFSSNFPAATLQAVLDAGNIATQDINLTGTINVTLIKPTNIEDMLGSEGTPLQILSKGVGGVCWIDIPSVSGYVPTSRELTINGVTFDLSANRSWTVSGATWGSITGTLTAQTDLTAYLSTNFYPLSSNPAGYLTQDNVLEYPNLASFPPTGVIGTIYIALDTGLFYSWNGTTYVLSSPPITGITGLGTTNRIPKWTSPTTIGNSFITEDIVGTVVIANSGRGLKGGNTVLSIQRIQTQIDFVLGNPGFNQPNILWSDNTTDGLDLYSTGRLAFRTGGTNHATSNLGLVQLSTGQIQLTQTPATGTTSDFILLRDTSGNVKQIAYPTIPSSGVTSVGLTMPSAFTVTNSPITSNGDIAVTGAGLISQYVRGDGTLANFPASTGGGASLSFYLNGSVSQGTFGGVAFREMDRTPILGAGTNFTINTNGYIQSFITDAGVPNLLEIPAGNWNFETYFSASSGGGSPSFYVELYKWNGTTLSLIASSSASPELITGGTNIDLYVSALAVPQTTLLATDRLAVRIYVNNSGRTITLHTEDNNLCQVITTFSTGLTALNGLTAQVQNLAVGTSGTDFGISSTSATHTFNLPSASESNRGALLAADWTTFNNKQNAAIKQGYTQLTGVTGVNVLASIQIPANWLASGDGFEIIITPNKSTTAANIQYVLAHDTVVNGVSNAITTGNPVLSTTARTGFIQRILVVDGTTLRNSMPANASSAIPVSIGTVGGTTTFNPAVNNWITLTVNPTVSTEVTGFNQLVIRKL